MLVGSRQRTKGLNLTLKQVKYLGAYFDQHLTWQSHVDYVLGRVREKLSAIYRVKQVYRAVIFCFTRRNCDVVWLLSNSNDTRHLEIHSKSLPSSDTFNMQLSLTERCTFHTTVQVYKIVNKISPPYLHDTFSFACGCYRSFW